MAQTYSTGPNGYVSDTPGVIGIFMTNGDELVTTVTELENFARIARKSMDEGIAAAKAQADAIRASQGKKCACDKCDENIADPTIASIGDKCAWCAQFDLNCCTPDILDN